MGEMGMNKPAIVLAVLLVLSVACSNAFAQSASAFTPDNSGINVRDRSAGATTADTQSSSKDDVDLTARVRRALINDKSLSIMAQNIKVVSSNGQVTLRGPVKSDQERNAIASDVQRVAGVNNIDNRLEV